MPSKHAKISYWKSGVRIIGYLLGINAALMPTLSSRFAAPLFGAFLILVVSEVVGIIEEIGC